MNFTISNKGIASGLAVSALVAACPDQAGSTELDSFVDANSIQALDVSWIIPEVVDDEISSNTSSIVVDLPHEPVWDEASQLRFEELVEMIALDEDLSEKDQIEYRKLKDLRNRTHPSRSFDEIVADQELHKKVAEAVNSIKTLIEYATKTFPSEAKTNRF